jgi:hypothetical protein
MDQQVVRMNIPAELQIGDTWEWTESLADYRPSAGWALSFSLYRYGQPVIQIDATPSGDDFSVSVPAATTAGKVPGEWQWTAYVTKGADRFTVGTGTVTLSPDLAAATSTTDLRTDNEKILDALLATQQRRATKDQESMQINGRAIRYLAPDDLERMIGIYTYKVKAQQGRLRRTVLTRFGGST